MSVWDQEEGISELRVLLNRTDYDGKVAAGAMVLPVSMPLLDSGNPTVLPPSPTCMAAPVEVVDIGRVREPEGERSLSRLMEMEMLPSSVG
jgi:hypothetical protein